MESFLTTKLNQRKETNTFRSLSLVDDSFVDFSSNDYLGVSKNNILVSPHLLKSGATGSRLISGNHETITKAEEKIASFHQAEAALIFNSGYDANIGLFSSLGTRFDTIIYDEYVHASIRDGIRLSYAKNFSFKHNDIDNLKEKLKKSTGEIFVAIESIYSMDGDSPDLLEIIALCHQFNAHLIVDEAHAIGVLGNGGGLIQKLNIGQSIFAHIVTFGKAMGCHGAAIIGSQTLKEYLINFARSFIYTTALPPHSAQIILEAYSFLESKKHQEELAKLNQNIALFSKLFKTQKSHIQSLKFNTTDELIEKSKELEKSHFFVKPIFHPTVPKGKERLRISLHSYNTQEEIKSLYSILKRI